MQEVGVASRECLVAVRCLIDSHRNAFSGIFLICLLMCNDNNVIRLQYPKMEHKSKCSWISRGLPVVSLSAAWTRFDGVDVCDGCKK